MIHLKSYQIYCRQKLLTVSSCFECILLVDQLFWTPYIPIWGVAFILAVIGHIFWSLKYALFYFNNWIVYQFWTSFYLSLLLVFYSRVMSCIFLLRQRLMNMFDTFLHSWSILLLIVSSFHIGHHLFQNITTYESFVSL